MTWKPEIEEVQLRPTTCAACSSCWQHRAAWSENSAWDYAVEGLEI